MFSVWLCAVFLFDVFLYLCKFPWHDKLRTLIGLCILSIGRHRDRDSRIAYTVL